ncbi:hypothetical protein ACFX1T_005427 [Malus domestica]
MGVLWPPTRLTSEFLRNPKLGLALIPFVTSRPGTNHFPGPLQHRSTILSALSPNHALKFCFWELTSNFQVGHFPGPLHHRSTILSALGPDHALTILFLGTHEQLPSGSSIMGLLSRATRLTFEFQWNPKPVSSQKTSC